MEKKDPKTLFYDKLADKFYYLLKNQFFRSWQPTEVISITQSTIIKSQPEISEYLRTHNVNLFNMDENIEKIIEVILLPQLKNTRIT